MAWLPSPSVVVMDSIARTEQTQARVDGARDAIRTNGDNRAGAAAALTAGYLGTCQTNTSQIVGKQQRGRWVNEEALYPIHRKDELAASTPAAAAGVASHRCGGMATACAVCCHSKDDAPGDRECRLPVECAVALEPAAPDCQSRCCRRPIVAHDHSVLATSCVLKLPTTA